MGWFCFPKWHRPGRNDADLPWMQVLANPEYLDWRRTVLDSSGRPLSREEQQRIEHEQAFLPVQVHEFLYLADTKTATRIGRIKYMGITHVLNLAGPDGACKTSTFSEAGLVYKAIDVIDREGYPLLSKHLLEARSFIATARNQGGKCLVYCMTGLNVSGVIVASEVMLTQKRPVLDVVAELRRKRGNACLQNSSFQHQLVALARTEGLLGPVPGRHGSFKTNVVSDFPAEKKNESSNVRERSLSIGSSETLPVQQIRSKLKNKDSDSFSLRDVPESGDLSYLEVMKNPHYLDWRKRIDPETGRIPDEDEQVRIEKEQGNMPVQISSEVFLADARSSKKVGRLKYMGITHVLNVAGPEGAPSSCETFAEAGIKYRMIDAKDREGYPMLRRHLAEARQFIQDARAGGGTCLVYCMTGYELSGVIAAADKLLSEQMPVLEVMALCRRQRGNAFLMSEALQEQLVQLARMENLLGSKPGRPDSIIPSLSVLKKSEPSGMVTAVKRAMPFNNSFSNPWQTSTNPESRSQNQVAHGIAARHMAARQRDAEINQTSTSPSFFGEQKQLSPFGIVKDIEHRDQVDMALGTASGGMNPPRLGSGYDGDSIDQGVLYSLFPRHVADAMMRGEQAPEDRSDCSTVFFGDIVGFTELSAQMDSSQVSDMLNRLFARVDERAALNGVYKLETIGDCYIAVSNLVADQAGDHVARMANFALDVLQVAGETPINVADHSQGFVQMRIGFDAGPVVGSVVGTSKKKYTVFGNTVNTASRMESSGVPGRIQCTKRAAELLRTQDQKGFNLIERGEMNVKGKGKMVTYFVEDNTEASVTSAALGHISGGARSTSAASSTGVDIRGWEEMSIISAAPHI